MVVDNPFVFDGLGSITDIARHKFEESYYTAMMTQIKTSCSVANVHVGVAISGQQRV